VALDLGGVFSNPIFSGVGGVLIGLVIGFAIGFLFAYLRYYWRYRHAIETYRGKGF